MKAPHPAPKSAETSVGKMAHNMSAPPRTTIGFVPFGAQSPSPATTNPAKACGLRRLLVADADTIIQTAGPAVSKRLQRLQQTGPLGSRHRQGIHDPVVAMARRRVWRLVGLILVAVDLIGEVAIMDQQTLLQQPLETLYDQLADLTKRLPPAPPELPAMALVQRLGEKARPPAPASSPLAMLWVLSHVNGHSFDRDGLALLAPGLVDGAAYSLDIPCGDIKS